MWVITKCRYAVDHVVNYWSIGEWTIFVSIICLVGFICLRGYGSRNNY